MSVLTDERIDFNAIKETVSMIQILDQYGLTDQFHRSGDGLRGACPLHDGHNKTQFRVSISQNVWHCFGDCNRGGSILDFVSRKEGVGLHEAARLIRGWFGMPSRLANHQPPRPRPAQPRVHEPNPPLRFSLSGLDTGHPYLAQRGLIAETITTFEIGYCRHGMMTGRIAIPIHNAKGQLVAYAGRWLGQPTEDKPKYLLPKGLTKSLEVFNYHRAIQAEPRDLLMVVEGFFDCMKVWQAGFHRVVSILGSTLSDTQAELIVNAVGSRGLVILLFDEDGAGRAGRLKARARLAGRVRLKTVEFDQEGTQPDHLTPQQLLALLH